MDLKPKAAPAIDAIASSVTSISFSGVEHKIKPLTEPSINRLSNEIMQMIIAKLELDDDVKKLVKLRLVSTRWNSLIEDCCQMKKSLLVNYAHFLNTDFNNSTPVKVDLKTVDFFGLMPKLFPNIEQLNILWYFDTHFDNAQIREVAVHIDSLSSLKYLELSGHFVAALPHLSRTLSQLEHISVNDIYRTLTEDHLLHIVSNLGQKCAVLYLENGIILNYNRILQWHNIKPKLFVNLTHLQILIKSGDCAQVVHFLSEHANSLKLLKFYAWGNPPLQLTLTVIDDLNKLTNLTVLKLINIKMDIAVLKQAAAQHRLASLSSVLTCKLCVKVVINVASSNVNQTNADKFTRVLSVILPNLLELDLMFVGDFPDKTGFVHQFKQHLDRFPKLRKYEIQFNSNKIHFW